MTESSSASKLRPAMLQLVDHRGNVVVVDGAARFTGCVARLPSFLAERDEVEVTLIVGFEAVQLRVVVVEGCDVRPGAIAVVSLVEWVAGGRRFRPNDNVAAAGDPRAGISGRLEQMSLVDVVQLLANGQRGALIEVHSESPLGTALPVGLIGLTRGQIAFARHGNDVGEDALFSILSSSRGSFSVSFEKAVPAANIQRETTFLLLEHLRRLDEAARVPGETQRHAPSSSNLRLDSVPEGNVVVRPAMSPTVVIPTTMIVEPRAKKKRPSLPPPLEEKHAAKTGRFSRFFDEVSQSEHPQHGAPPPVVDDADLAVTDAVRFASLAITMTNTNGPFERDTDIVDRALISA